MIADLEEISLNALPALQTLFYDGWIVRMSKGFTRRANSVQTFRAPTQELQEKISYCERLYGQNNLPTVFKMTPASQPANLDTELEAHGYRSEGHTSVHTCALDSFHAAPCEKVRIVGQWNDEWFDPYCRMNHVDPAWAEILKSMLCLIVPQTAYALVTDEHTVRACGLGVLQESYLGLFDIVVDPAARRRGYGKQIVTSLLAWGKAHGARTAYLQVISDNEPALNLYSQFGFVEQYQYGIAFTLDMHILIVTTGGITRMFRNWPEVLLAKALVRRGHRVRALTYYDGKSDALNTRKEDIDGVEVQRIEPTGWLTRGFWSALQRGPRPDVIHIQHLRNKFAFQAAYYAQRENIPYVVTPIGPLHDQYLSRDRDRPLDAEPLYYNLIWSSRDIVNRAARDGRVKRHVENYFMHYPVHHASAVIACSDHERAIWSHLHIESETIPLWVDVPFISGLRGVTYPEEFSRPLILFVGQFKYRKGFDVLARAMPNVLEHFPNATFLFVGHSPIHRRELEMIAHKDGTSDHLKIMERVSEEDKVRLYNSADVYVLPTRYEGFGLPPLEAMAAGCPVIASDIPVVDEVVRHEYNGLLVPREDPVALALTITRLLREEELRACLVQNGLETLNHFDEKELVARNEAVYERVTGAVAIAV